MFRYSAILLIAVVLSSCQFRHKVVEETWGDGTPKRVKVYKGKGENRELLEETVYYSNKQIQMTGTYKNGQRDGHWASYYDNGQMWSEGWFKEGKANGRRIVYYPSGKVRYEGDFINDQRAGKWLFYDETGQKVKEVDYGTP